MQTKTTGEVFPEMGELIEAAVALIGEQKDGSNIPEDLEKLKQYNAGEFKPNKEELKALASLQKRMMNAYHERRMEEWMAETPEENLAQRELVASIVAPEAGRFLNVVTK